MLVRVADATVPPIYSLAMDTVDPNGSGDISMNALIRVLSTSNLPAATTEKVCSGDHLEIFVSPLS